MSEVAYFANSDEVTGIMLSLFAEFLESEAGMRTVSEISGSHERFTFLLHTENPESKVVLDLVDGTVGTSLDHEPTVSVTVDASDLHDVLLDRLGPVEISRMFETEALKLKGPPPVLGQLIGLASYFQENYRSALVGQEREDLLDTPMPETGKVWEGPKQIRRMLGVPRAWQKKRDRGERK